MYCGATMPAPTAAPAEPAPRKELPKDLDKAFQRAMLHGDMRQLREVLGGVEARPVAGKPAPRESRPQRPTPPRRAATPAPRPAPTPHLTPEALPSTALEVVDELPPISVEPVPAPPGAANLYAALSQAVVQAGSWEDDPLAAAAVLDEARATIDALIERLGELEAPPELVLPPFRQPWALVVQPPGDAERLPAVAEALGVDLATARQVAVLPHPRTALRSADRDDLEGRAARYQLDLDLPARVLDEAALRAQPAARLVLSLPAEGPWRTTISSTWEPETTAIPKLPARDDPPPTLRLVVVGEVISIRYREVRGRRKDDGRLSTHGDRRLRVLDLHHDDGVLRVVDGITELSGWRGLDPRSSALAFRSLAEVLAEHYPDIPVTARCLCRPTRKPEARDDGRVEASGWPAFEEHSRACRLLFGVSSP